jgi:hypothetical protein
VIYKVLKTIKIIGISGFLMFPIMSKAQTTSSWNTGPTSSVPSVNGVNCDPAILQQQQQNQLNAVNDAQALAKSNYSILPEGMQQLSCIQNLMNGGFNLMFEPPNIGALISEAEQAACTEATSLYTQATQPLTNAIQTANSTLNTTVGASSVLGTSGVSTGISIQPYSQFGVTGVPVTSNIGNVLNNSQQSLGIPNISGGIFGN